MAKEPSGLHADVFRCQWVQVPIDLGADVFSGRWVYGLMRLGPMGLGADGYSLQQKCQGHTISTFSFLLFQFFIFLLLFSQSNSQNTKQKA